ncbi:lipid A biosynthesis acyltransferase [Chitinivibrio alkaliphilus]|uniref:Lipid A biosynthesis acyltransferase n=1 Tax=Chitinivibrio alkaliphilus ACht1 TaxID=1313304 RepID=U7D9Y6_9BACT|nr:lipid A biosynthesis acyltransferase [Chitinivibrio alkaliphilus]ERP31907.1 lipid A biosynthesis acyltransferase [Chitinivibrio alkaliphilus ACht1]
MSLSKHLQSPEILSDITGKSFADIKKRIIAAGNEWYKTHPEEESLIRKNLTSLGKEDSDQLVAAIQEGILVHYAEKITALSLSPEEFSQFLNTHIDYTDASKILQENSQDTGILMATPHFGGVEFVTPTLSRMGHTTNVVLKFSTPELSAKIRKYSQNMEDQGDFAPIHFIELGKNATGGALDMYAALRRHEVLFTVFDEETDHSQKVTLFGKEILGGAGLDKLIAPAKGFTKVYTVFMVRLDENSYKMVLKEIPADSPEPVQEMYNALEDMLTQYLEQWYFLHEEVPLVRQ